MKLALFDVEDRLVAVDAAAGKAWAFAEDGSWREAPGLVRKAALVGPPVSEAEAAKLFPDAKLDAIPSNSNPAKDGP